MQTQHNLALRAWFDELKRGIDLHDVAERLDLRRSGAKGNYHSPHHTDKSPSLSIYDNGRSWKDWSTETGGSCIDLVIHCLPDIDGPMDAAKLLGDWYGMPMPSTEPRGLPSKKSTEEYIADKARADASPAVSYLLGRGIDEAVMALFVRPSHVMDHIATAPHLRQKFDALPIKTARIFKQQLLQSGVVPKHAGKLLDDVEKRIHGRRHAHMTAISVPSLERLGLEAIPEIEDARMPP